MIGLKIKEDPRKNDGIIVVGIEEKVEWGKSTMQQPPSTPAAVKYA